MTIVIIARHMMDRLEKLKFTAIPALLAVSLTGCAAMLSPASEFADVSAIVYDRTGHDVEWDIGSPDDLAVRGRVGGLLSRQLTPASAIQIALLKNKSLQAMYTDVGIAQADLVQAGLLTNPVFDAVFTWPYEPETAAANIALGLAFNFIELFKRPLRQAVAASKLEEVKLRISLAVLAHAARTNQAFIDHVAAKQEAELFAQVVKSARATVTTATELRQAGNITALEFEQQQSLLTTEKVRLADAETQVAVTRERLNVLMGLTGDETTDWSAPTRLPDIPGREANTHEAEPRAIEASLELAAAEQKLVTLGYKHQLTTKDALIPELDVGVEWERDDGEEEVGPKFDVVLPVFDRGEARKARDFMEVRRAQDEYWGIAVRVRSAARLLRADLLTKRKRAQYYMSAVLPQRQRILSETQKQANAMTVNVFDIITAKRRQIEASQNFVAALRDYWRARVRFLGLMSGALPEDMDGGDQAMAARGGNGAEDTGDH